MIVLGGLYAANAGRTGKASTSSSSSSAAAGGAADAEGNAADAQAWIDEWKGDGPAPTSAPVEDTPEASPKP